MIFYAKAADNNGKWQYKKLDCVSKDIAKQEGVRWCRQMGYNEQTLVIQNYLSPQFKYMKWYYAKAKNEAGVYQFLNIQAYDEKEAREKADRWCTMKQLKKTTLIVQTFPFGN